MAWKRYLLEGDAAVLSDAVPSDVKSQAASAGVATEASRRDHLHNLDLSASALDELGAPTGAISFGNQEIQSVSLEKVGALPAGFDGQVVLLTTDDHPYVYIA